MCCVFTCCGWMIDLFQRLWTFTMSCCISSAVCCVLFMSSMSGIAMGYNYSLAEYIDLKETNVSVYLKRGVFDDEVGDDMDWRRSGRMPVAGLIKDNNLVTGDSGEETVPPRPGRRMDDSLVQSDEQNKFEGSLMKLTAKPIDFMTTRADIADNLDEAKKYPKDSLDQIKAIHSLVNMRRNNMNRNTVQYSDKPANTDERIVLPGARRKIPEPDTPDKHNIYMDGRAVPFEHVTYKINPNRLKVPDPAIVEAANWFLPKGQIPPEYMRTRPDLDDNLLRASFTMPTPIRVRNEPQRPTRVMSIQVDTKPTQPSFDNDERFKNADMRRLGNVERMNAMNNLLLDKANLPNFRKAGYGQGSNDEMPKSEESDYEEQAIRGLPPHRTKRNIESPKDDLVVKNASYKYIPNIIWSILGKKKDERRRDDLSAKLLMKNVTVQDRQGFKNLGNISNPDGNHTYNPSNGKSIQNFTTIEVYSAEDKNLTMNVNRYNITKSISISKINDSAINVLPIILKMLSV